MQDQTRTAEDPAPEKRKQPLSEAELETETLLQPPSKKQKVEEDQQRQTPDPFWDNLSQVWLTRRALREFDRRTVWPAVPAPPHQTGKERVNIEKLKHFAKHDGANIDDIRNYPNPKVSVSSSSFEISSSQSGFRKRAETENESDTSAGRRISAYDQNFEQNLVNHGIYPPDFSHDNRPKKPANLEDLRQRLAQPRRSLSPSRFTDAELQDFKKKNREALTESKVMSSVLPVITGTADIPSQENLTFGNLKVLTDDSTTKAQPDLYDGIYPHKLNKGVRDKLGPYIVPSTNTAAPCLPNFFTEVIGWEGSIDVCQRQAMYNGALGTRGVHELRSYIDTGTAYDDKAYTITSTYQSRSRTLAIYATHTTPSKNQQSSAEYHMTELEAVVLTKNLENFRQGASAFRNARDWAKEKREELVAAANSKILNGDRSGSGPSAQHVASPSPTHLESETSTNKPGSE